jgi:signal transduction histidine kinase
MGCGHRRQSHGGTALGHSPHRGADRRRTTASYGVLDWSWLVAGVGLLILISVVVALADEPFVAFRGAEITAALWAAAVVLGLVVSVSAAIHWRATGRIRGLVLSASFALVAILGLAEPLTAGSHWLALRSALLITAGGLFIHAVRGPDVDTRFRPLAQFSAAVLLVAAIYVVLIALLAATGTTLELATTLTVLVVLLWAVAGVSGIVRARQRSSILLGWLGWTAAAIAFAEATLLAPFVNLDLVPWAGAAVIVSGLLIGAIGAPLALSRHVVGSRAEHHARELRRQARETAAATEQRHRNHEARNALLAIEGALHSLREFDDTLTEDERLDLEGALLGKIADLRDLVLSGRGTRSANPRPFQIGEAIDRCYTLARSRGLVIEVLGDLTPLVAGSLVQTVHILENLVLNAELHGGTGRAQPITIAVEGTSDEVQIRVMDRGPGVPQEHVEHVFDGGFRLSDDMAGEGLGLQLARHFARRQGGDLVYEDRGGRGACFVLSLRQAQQPVSQSARPQELDE